MHAEVSEVVVSEPLVDGPAALSGGLGDSHLTAFQALDHALDHGPRGALQFLGRERAAALPCAVDHELQFVRSRRCGRGLLIRPLPRGLVLAGLRRGPRFVSPSLRDRSASRWVSRRPCFHAVLSDSLLPSTFAARTTTVVMRP